MHTTVNVLIQYIKQPAFHARFIFGWVFIERCDETDLFLCILKSQTDDMKNL